MPWVKVYHDTILKKYGMRKVPTIAVLMGKNGMYTAHRNILRNMDLSSYLLFVL